PMASPCGASHTTGPPADEAREERNAASAAPSEDDGASTTAGTTPAAVSGGMSGCSADPASTRSAARSADHACQLSSPGATRGLLSKTVSTPGRGPGCSQATGCRSAPAWTAC